jgi:hypothetical protein
MVGRRVQAPGLSLFFRPPRVRHPLPIWPDGTRDEVNAPGDGFVDEFDSDGNLMMRLAPKGPLNSPWGLTLAPAQVAR